MKGPSRFYGPRLWALGVGLARVLPAAALRGAARTVVGWYGGLDRRRREVVTANLEPVVGTRAAANVAADRLFREFGEKLVDLWRFEAGRLPAETVGELCGRAHLEAALARGRGVLLVTLHLGNWELGALALGRFGRRLMVLTQVEPGGRFTEQRQASRAALGIDTLVVGENPFAFVEVIRRLGEGGMVALLADRPAPSTAVRTTFLGRAFEGSRGPAELARASGAAVLPVSVVRLPGSWAYRAEVLPEVAYDRRALGTVEARARFTGEILRAFEPWVRQYPSQWFHFVPVWPGETNSAATTKASPV